MDAIQAAIVAALVAGALAFLLGRAVEAAAQDEARQECERTMVDVCRVNATLRDELDERDALVEGLKDNLGGTLGVNAALRRQCDALERELTASERELEAARHRLAALERYAADNPYASLRGALHEANERLSGAPGAVLGTTDGKGAPVVVRLLGEDGAAFLRERLEKRG